MAERTYTDEQVREILRRAVERGSDTGGLAREDLLAAAGDVGIAPEAVDAAILELEAEGELKEELSTLQRERRHGLASAFATWAIVNAGLFGIDWATPGGPWFFWPLGAWGIALLLRLKGEVFANRERDRKEAGRRLEQRRRRREREQADARRLRERAQRQNSGGLEGVIERGVEDLLGAAARRIAGVRVEDGAAEERDYGPEPGARDRARARRPR
jgi:2TM domain